MCKYNDIYYFVIYHNNDYYYTIYKSTDLVNFENVVDSTQVLSASGVPQKYNIYNKNFGRPYITTNNEIVVPISFSLQDAQSTVIYGVIIVEDLANISTTCKWIEFGTIDGTPYWGVYINKYLNDYRYYTKDITDLSSILEDIWRTQDYENSDNYFNLLTKVSPFTNEVSKALDILDVEGTSDYDSLSNKPSINGVELIGNKTSEDLHISGGDSGLTSDNVQDAIDEVNTNKVNGEGITLSVVSGILTISYDDGE